MKRGAKLPCAYGPFCMRPVEAGQTICAHHRGAPASEGKMGKMESKAASIGEGGEREGEQVKQLRAALEGLLWQVGQMRGMFDDEDGAIERAVKDAEEALEYGKG